MTSTRDQMALELQDQVRGPNRWKRAHCTFCELRGLGPDRRGNWCLDTNRGYYHCFRCHVKGFLPGYAPDEDYEPDEIPVDPSTLGAPEGFIPLVTGGDTVRRAIRYVVKRGITREIAAATQLGAVVRGPLRNRVVVPIFGADNRTWMGWSARLFVTPKPPAREDEDEFAPEWREPPKYRYPPGMPRRKMVYNQHALSIETDEPALVVEGVFDALPYYPHTVALLGKPVDEQLPILLDTKRPLVVCLDGDAWCEGQMLALRLQFKGLSRVGYVRLPPKADPNSVDPDWLREEARRAF